jgi:hypothetical protein
MATLTKAAKYEANHGSSKFVCPAGLLLYDKTITNNATMVVRVPAEAAHKSCLDDYASFEAAEHGVAKFLHDTVDKVCYNNLKDANTFYTKVMALNIITLLDANSWGLHALDTISLHTNMS